ATGLESGPLEDAALAAAYDAAINDLSQIQAQADQAYAQAMSQFNAMENLRGNLHNALQLAADRIRQASDYIGYHGEHISNRSLQLLQQAKAVMPTSLA